jgi:hypothetical protein
VGNSACPRGGCGQLEGEDNRPRLLAGQATQPLANADALGVDEAGRALDHRHHRVGVEASVAGQAGDLADLCRRREGRLAAALDIGLRAAPDADAARSCRRCGCGLVDLLVGLGIVAGRDQERASSGVLRSR